jgi:hypothetical protein
MAANWTSESAGVQINTDTAWQTYTLENIAIDTASTNNIALLIHVADINLLAGTDKIYIADVHMNEGATISPYVRPTLRDEYDECQRFMMKSFGRTVTPARSTSDFDGALGLCLGSGTNDHVEAIFVRYPVPMFKEPTKVYYSPGENSSNWWNEQDSNSDGIVTTYHNSDTSFFARAGSATGATGERLYVHYTSVAEIVA